MALVDVLKHLEFEKLTDEQKSDLTKRFRKYRRDLQTALNAVDHSLELLAQEPKPAPKARTTRRTPKR